MQQIEPQAVADGISSALTEAWNAGDARAFARQFTDDALFVNIFAMQADGQEAIVQMHQMIFDTVYRGSVNRFVAEKVRSIGGGSVVAQIRADVSVPSGPLAGTVRTLATAVIVDDNGTFKIAAFQNTREQAPPPLPPS